MIKLYVKLSILTMAFFLILPTCESFRGRGFGRSSTKYDSKAPSKQSTMMGSGGTGVNGQVPNPSPTRRGLGMSAWGLITLIISIILAMAGMYYFSICYPVLCKKSRKYDMITSPNVA